VIAGQGVKSFNCFPATGKTPAINKIITEAGEEFEGPIDFVGIADVVKRTKLYHGAIATIVATDYIEPFGGVNVESQMCGTPVLTTDFGAFVETIEHGKTGFRCHTLEQFVWAAKQCPKLDPNYIRQRALEKYSIERVRHQYDEYFHMLIELWNEGWYATNPDRTELDWLNDRGVVGQTGCDHSLNAIEDEGGSVLGATGN
jgi:glycosyltransferase involved in cell wall biosynthesis